MTAPSDREARERTVARRERSLLVEASAGTGKTHAIIEVIVELCVRRADRLPLSRLAAVTFTEKAAGELQDRLRKRLAEIVESSDADDPTRARARESLEEVDRAQVGTIHGFCSSLLRERPIEAGLVPDFRMLLPEASAALARRAWEEWWRQEIDERPDGALGRALRAGIRMAGGDDEMTLTALAADLYEKRARIQDARLPDAGAATVLAAARRLREQAQELRRQAEAAGNPVADTLGAIDGWLESLPDDLAAIRERQPFAPAIRFKPRWKDEEIDRWREKDYKPFLESLPGTEYWPLLVDLLHRLADEPGGYLDTVARRKRRESLLDFDDLLFAARHLLRRSPAARSHFRGRYAVVIVDEFQDTDPIQMEIVLRLAHAEGGDEDWTRLVPEPGRLLLVGDPKQSIYRFRRADLETYTAVRELLGGNREIFVANRRSVPPILAWVNAVFGAAMAPPVASFQSPYSPVEPWGVRPEPAQKRVVYLEPPSAWRADSEKWRAAEAESIAGYLAAAIEGGTLPVGDGRPARAGDVAILVRSNDGIGILQEAVARSGLDAVVDGGLDFFRREEPAAVLAALRAIDNPHDPIALYAALKSFLFAFSDEELFLARESGAAFDILRAELAPEALREALALLARLHREREERPASETLLDLLDATGAFVKASARRVGGLQAQANLHQLTSLARELEASSPSFGSVVAGLAAIGRTDASEPRAFEESHDAVRILTVHKAKGLEFPVVVLAGFGSFGHSGAEGLLVPRRGGSWGVSIKRGGEMLESPDFDALRREDDDRDRAEIRRLLYVAATRAEDWFVLSRWRNVTESRKGTVNDPFDRTALAVLGPIALSDALSSLVELRPSPPEAPHRSPRRRRASPAAAAALEREREEIAARPERLARLGAEALRRAGGEHASAEDRPFEERAPSEEPSLAARVGCAVHRAMEIVVRGGDPAAAVATAALEWDLGEERREEVAAMIETLTKVGTLASTGRRIAEFPVLFRSPDDGALVEGKIDLLVEGERGWTIVDYKTDRVDRRKGGARAHFERYRPQLREYANALGVLGVPVARGCVVSARSGEVFDLL